MSQIILKSNVPSPGLGRVLMSHMLPYPVTGEFDCLIVSEVFGGRRQKGPGHLAISCYARFPGSQPPA